MGLSLRQIEKRNPEIIKLRKLGWKLKDLAVKFKLTKSRVAQIIKEKNGTFS